MAENLTLSRPGAQNLGSDPAKMFRDVFTGEVLTAFDEHNIMKDWHKMRTITHGKSASFAVMGRANARYHTAGEAILAATRSPRTSAPSTWTTCSSRTWRSTTSKTP